MNLLLDMNQGFPHTPNHAKLNAQMEEFKMTYNGHIENGMIVPDEPIAIENGTRILFDITVESTSKNTCPESESTAPPSLTQLLSRFAGKARALPEDAAENHDHYLYGLPKK